MHSPQHLHLFFLLCLTVATIHAFHFTESYAVIVARYKESIDWLQPIKEHCLIYNKGTPLNISNEILIPNVGRESETYLRYIIDHYESLPAVVVFTQGSIAVHRGADHHNNLIKLKDAASIANMSEPSFIFYIDRASSNTSVWDPDWNHELQGEEWYNAQGYLGNQTVLFQDFFLQHIDSMYPNPIYIHTNGIFAVHSSLIYNRPKEYYEKLIGFVNHHINPSEGYFIERSWEYIFRPLSRRFASHKVRNAVQRRMIAQAPWQRCREIVKALPNQVHEVQLEYSIVSCGLYPYEEDEMRLFPSAYSPYFGLTTGIGIRFSPYQLAKYLKYVGALNINTYVEVGIDEGGGLFQFTTEWLRKTSENVLTIALDGSEDFINLPIRRSRNTFSTQFANRKNNESPLICEEEYHPIKNAYNDNLQSYILSYTLPQSVMMYDSIHGYFDMYPRLAIDLLFLNGGVLTEEQFRYNYEQGMFSAATIVFSHIVDNRYPWVGKFWQQEIKAKYPAAHIVEITDQYADVMMREEGVSSSTDRPTFGIGIFFNPIYFDCRSSNVNDLLRCDYSLRFPRCLNMIRSITGVPTLNIIETVFSVCGMMSDRAPAVQKNPSFIQPSLEERDLSMNANSTTQQTSISFFPSQLTKFQFEDGTRNSQLPRDLGYLLLNMIKFPDIHSFIDIGKAQFGNYGEYMICTEFLTKHLPAGSFRYSVRVNIDSLPEEVGSNSYAKISLEYLDHYLQFEQPSKDGQFPKRSLHSSRQQQQNNTNTTFPDSSSLQTFLETFTRKEKIVDIAFVHAEELTAEELESTVTILLQHTRILVFTHVMDSRYPHIQSYWKNVLKKNTAWQNHIWDCNPDRRSEDTFGIGVFVNPKFYDCLRFNDDDKERDYFHPMPCFPLPLERREHLSLSTNVLNPWVLLEESQLSGGGAFTLDIYLSIPILWQQYVAYYYPLPPPNTVVVDSLNHHVNYYCEREHAKRMEHWEFHRQQLYAPLSGILTLLNNFPKLTSYLYLEIILLDEIDELTMPQEEDVFFCDQDKESSHFFYDFTSYFFLRSSKDDTSRSFHCTIRLPMAKRTGKKVEEKLLKQLQAFVAYQRTSLSSNHALSFLDILYIDMILPSSTNKYKRKDWIPFVDTFLESIWDMMHVYTKVLIVSPLHGIFHGNLITNSANRTTSSAPSPPPFIDLIDSTSAPLHTAADDDQVIDENTILLHTSLRPLSANTIDGNFSQIHHDGLWGKLQKEQPLQILEFLSFHSFSTSTSSASACSSSNVTPAFSFSLYSGIGSFVNPTDMDGMGIYFNPTFYRCEKDSHVLQEINGDILCVILL